MEVCATATDERDILELLKDELDFIGKGGYGRSVRTPWQNKSTLQDSLTCINYGDPNRAQPWRSEPNSQSREVDERS